MADLEGVPQWKRDLIRRRRALQQQSQSTTRRGGHADMLLQSPASYDLSTDPTDCSEDGSTTERSTPLRDTDTHTDSGEELTYGPGIVKKLKSRYLSLTLREANKTRPAIHGLRRATSLEHVLEDEKPAIPPRKYQPSVAAVTTRQTRYRQPTRAQEAVRRARSVDALARCDSRSETEDLLSPIGRESPTIQEIPEPPPLPSPTLRPKRPTPLLKDTERPPPDLVKQALKIFEGQPGKKMRTPNTGQVADKVRSFSETQKQIKKTNGARLPRPAVPPRGGHLVSISPEHKHVPVATQTTPSLLSRPPPSPKKLANHKDERERSISPVYVNRHPVILAPIDMSPVKTCNDFPALKGIKPLDLKSPEISPRNSLLKSPDLVSPKERTFRELHERNGSSEIISKYARTSTPDPEMATQPATAEVSLISPTIPRKGQPSNRYTSDSSEDDAVFEESESDQPKTKRIEKTSLEKISKAGTTTQFSFNNNINGVNGDVNRSYLPSAKQNNSTKNSSKVVSNINNSSKSKVPDLIQMSNSKNSAVLAAKPMTVADAKLINPVTSSLIVPPKLTSEQNNTSGSADNTSVLFSTVPSSTIKSQIVTACPTSPNRESRVTALSGVRRVKDIESSPALVHYDSPSPPQVNASQNLVLTTREIEKNLKNVSKSLLDRSDSQDRDSNQPVDKVPVSMFNDPCEETELSENLNVVEYVNSRVIRHGVIEVEVEASTSNVISSEYAIIGVTGVTDVVISTKEVKNENPSNVVSSAISNGGVAPTNKLGSGRKPQWHQQEVTTMLFDFSKRKGIPDYIENDGLVRRNRREKPKVGVGTISIEGLSGESCTDGGSDSGDEDWARRPPSPCDVAFENDNVLINGRSNISAGKSRTKHLKIQFDESLTTTFEYPSEASVGEEHFPGTNSSASPASPIATGGPLSSYTPSKVTLQADTYQLGVTRSHVQSSEKNGDPASTNGDTTDSSHEALSSNGTSNDTSEDSKATDDLCLKPCQEDQSHNWSHETHIGAGDLLF